MNKSITIYMICMLCLLVGCREQNLKQNVCATTQNEPTAYIEKETHTGTGETVSVPIDTVETTEKVETTIDRENTATISTEPKEMQETNAENAETQPVKMEEEEKDRNESEIQSPSEQEMQDSQQNQTEAKEDTDRPDDMTDLG